LARSSGIGVRWPIGRKLCGPIKWSWKARDLLEELLRSAGSGRVNAQHVKNVPGRKTDVGDAQWLATLARRIAPRFVCAALAAARVAPDLALATKIGWPTGFRKKSPVVSDNYLGR
jgi:hypothetical protein